MAFRTFAFFPPSCFTVKRNESGTYDSTSQETPLVKHNDVFISMTRHVRQPSVPLSDNECFLTKAQLM